MFHGVFGSVSQAFDDLSFCMDVPTASCGSMGQKCCAL